MAWNWSPEQGRWRLEEHGYPSAPEPISVSTVGIAAAERYDYWRDLAFSDFEPDPVTRHERLAFSARAQGLCSVRADFFFTDSGAVSGGREARHIAQDGLDSVSIGLVLRGERRSEQADDDAVLVRAGQLFAYDAAQRSRVAWTAHKGIYLVIRRPDAAAALGKIPPPAQIKRRLEQSPMRHVVVDQFQMLARHMYALDPTQRAYLLDQTVQLTLFALSRPSEFAPASEHAPYLPAALRFIEVNLSNPQLDAGRIAAALNCSRATLYRAFAQEGMGVAETIRDMRLDRARYLIETAPTRAIATIAVECGLFDTVNFSRQFRRRFGLSPTDARAGAAKGPHLSPPHGMTRQIDVA